MRNRVNIIEGVYSVYCGSGHLRTKHNFPSFPNKSGMNPVVLFSEEKKNMERMLSDTFFHFANEQSPLCIKVCLFATSSLVSDK